MAEENRRTVLHDILKRERENKVLQKEKSKDISKTVSGAKSQIEEKASSATTNTAKSKTGLSTYDDALVDVALDLRFYFLRDGDYIHNFKEIFDELKVEMNKYGINSRKYLEYIRDSFDRYKNTHKMLPLDPMNLKAFKYVESSIRDLLKMMQQKFKK